MYLIHEKELFRAFECLKADLNDPIAKKIVLLSGTFGSGKSFFLKSLIPALLEENHTDYVFEAKYSSNLKFTIDILQSLADNSYYVESDKLPPFSSNESSFINEQFANTLTTLRNKDTSLFEKIYEREYLKDNFHYHYSSIDNIEDLSDTSICNTIESLFPQQEKYKTFFANPTKIAIESLIVDLMTVLFAGNSNFEKPEKKYKVLFVLDGFDKHSWTVQQWLLDKFIPLLDTMHFSDFTSYDTSFLSKDTKLSDFFDFRFLLSFREDLTLGRFADKWLQISDATENIALQPASDLIMHSFFKSEGIDEADYKELAKNTYGIPYIFNLKVEYKKVGDSEIDNISLVYHLAGQKILSDFEEQQADWIRCTAFLDEFDERALEFFPIIGKKSKLAFSFMKELKDIYTITNGKLRLRAELQDLIKKATLFDSPGSSKGYQKIAEQYYELLPILDEYSSKDFELLSELAYFNWFDKDFVLPKVFPDKLSDIDNLLDKRKELFLHDNGMIKVSDDEACKIDTLNKILDSELYSKKVEYLKEIQTEYQKNLQEKLTELGNAKKNCAEQLSEIRKELDLQLEKLPVSSKSKTGASYKKSSNYRVEDNSKYIKYFALIALCVLLGIKPELLLGIVFESKSTFSIASNMFFILAVLLAAYIGIDFFSSSDKLKSRPKNTDIPTQLSPEETILEELKTKEANLKNRLHAIDKDISLIGNKLSKYIIRNCDK